MSITTQNRTHPTEGEVVKVIYNQGDRTTVADPGALLGSLSHINIPPSISLASLINRIIIC